MIIGRRSIETTFFPKLSLNGTTIEYVDTAKNLGIIFNRTLTWNNHISSKIGKVYGMLRSLWITQYFTPLRIRTLIAKTYLIPTLLYGCELFATSDAESNRRLNVIFNNIARYIYGLKRTDHVSQYSKQIFSVCLNNFLKYKSLILLHKIVYTKKPGYLFNKLRFTRSNRSNNIIQIKHSYLISERQFFVSSIRLWNSLPCQLQQISNAFQFKIKLLYFFQHN